MDIVFEMAGALGFSGGGIIGAIIGFFANVLLESHKSKKRKSEAIYPEERNAAKEFNTLYYDFMPRYSHPDMIWDDACEIIASNSGKTAEKINLYIRKHSTVLSRDVEQLLSKAENTAREINFELIECNPDNAFPENFSSSALKWADALHKNLTEVKEKLREK